MMSATLIAFFAAILVIALITRKADSAPVETEELAPVETRPLKQLEKISRCPFEVKEDVDPERTPVKIQKVVCKPTTCPGCDVSFHCVQAMVEFEVFYKNSDSTTHLPIEYGCYYISQDAEEVVVNPLPEASS